MARTWVAVEERLLDHELLGSSSSGYFSEIPFPLAEVDRALENEAQDSSGQAHWRECCQLRQCIGDPEPSGRNADGNSAVRLTEEETFLVGGGGSSCRSRPT